LKQDHTGSNRF
ncbi:hypothetical protein CP08DC60_1354B, partial [Chlamydia psittaci 08DC60]